MEGGCLPLINALSKLETAGVLTPHVQYHISLAKLTQADGKDL
jgi:hypothetical protein